MTERREIVPSKLYREGHGLTAWPHERRQLFTGLDCFCRHYQSLESVARYHARRRVSVPEDVGCLSLFDFDGRDQLRQTAAI